MLQREIDPGQAADIDKFERVLAGYLAGEVDEDVFRVFRLTNGIYGQRQGGHNQMVRVKIPYGGVTPEQLDMFGRIADEYSRGWGHITTRQNIQFHFVPLERVPDAMRELGLGRASPPARPAATPSATSWAATSPAPARTSTSTSRRGPRPPTEHFLRNPLAQRLPRKFKINFSGCETDCGQAMFNDVGVIASRRDARGRHRRARLPGVRGRRPRRQPVPGPAARGLHAPRGAAPHARVDPAGLPPAPATATTSSGPA